MDKSTTRVSLGYSIVQLLGIHTAYYYQNILILSSWQDRVLVLTELENARIGKLIPREIYAISRNRKKSDSYKKESQNRTLAGKQEREA